jgi:hypothetical protein
MIYLKTPFTKVNHPAQDGYGSFPVMGDKSEKENFSGNIAAGKNNRRSLFQRSPIVVLAL